MASWPPPWNNWSLDTEEIWKNMELDGFFPQDTTMQEPPQTVSNEIVAGSGTELTNESFLTKDTIMQEPPQTVAEGTSGGKGKGKGKRRVVEEQLDEATLKKQRRMIKNRESAARSRERKQAFVAELESSVAHLEEENAQLMREQADREKQRYKQLMESIIPVEEKPKQRKQFGRQNSF